MAIPRVSAMATVLCAAVPRAFRRPDTPSRGSRRHRDARDRGAHRCADARAARSPAPRTQTGRGGGVGWRVSRQDLERDVTVEPGIAGSIDFTHPASAGEPFDLEHADARAWLRIRETRDDGPPEAEVARTCPRRETLPRPGALRAATPPCRATAALSPHSRARSASRSTPDVATSGVKDREHVLPALGDHSR